MKTRQGDGGNAKLIELYHENQLKFGGNMQAQDSAHWLEYIHAHLQNRSTPDLLISR